MLLAAAPAAAKVEERTAMAAFVEARAASDAGATARASAGYAAALAAAPDNPVIAGQALAHAIPAGDWPLALRAARLLESNDELLPDARFLLLSDALRRGDWADAERQLAAVEKEEVFAFLLPIVRAWIAAETKEGDPLAILAQGKGVQAYAAEQRALLATALGRRDGPPALLAGQGLGPRAQRLRIAGAAALAARGDRDTAAALLQGEDPPFVAARALLDAGRPIPGAIDDPASATAELFVSLAFDLHREEMTSLAVAFARLATFLSPDSSEAWLVASDLLSAEGDHDGAAALLGNVPADDPYAAIAATQRIRLLARAGQEDAAIAAAEAAARAKDADDGDWLQLGELYDEAGRHRDAAQAYGSALSFHDGGSGNAWPLWLLRGGAFYEAGDWPAAREALRRAHALAPDEAVVLNYLGYAMLEHGEDRAAAEEMIRKAHRLAPESPAISDSLGWALHLSGRTGEALPLLEKAAEGEPADVEINEHLGDAYFALGRRIEARFAWRAALVHADGDAAERIRGKIAGEVKPRFAGH